MSISKNKVVTLHYTLRDGASDGAILDETIEGNPMSFIFGIGQMIPGFEVNLENKEEGNDSAFLLSPEEGYGPREKKAIVTVPRSNFIGSDGKIDENNIKLGSPVRMKNQDGHTFQGTIVGDEQADALIVDFNHPMAGRSLHFSVKVEKVRDASQEELDHGHAHDVAHH
jgi:FKBP-type peptidyl-prolyl cis-trans isomerase SlyD